MHSFTEAVIVSVMGPTERDRELVADLASHRAGLSESKVMGVGRASSADQTWL